MSRLSDTERERERERERDLESFRDTWRGIELKWAVGQKEYGHKDIPGGTLLALQGLGLCASTAGGTGLIPGQAKLVKNPPAMRETWV